MRKIGLLGGTFDPVHNGHLNLAFEMKEKEKLDEVWFIPAAKNPLKPQECSAALDRLHMLKLAIQDIPFFKAVELEIHKEGPSFTIETLNELHTRFSNQKFYLILGQDAFANFYRWKQPKEILTKASLLIGARQGEEVRPAGDDEIQQALVMALRQIKLMDISSTEIRERVKKSFCISHLVPAKVVDYIYENSLYSLSS